MRVRLIGIAVLVILVVIGFYASEQGWLKDPSRIKEDLFKKSVSAQAAGETPRERALPATTVPTRAVTAKDQPKADTPTPAPTWSIPEPLPLVLGACDVSKIVARIEAKNWQTGDPVIMLDQCNEEKRYLLVVWPMENWPLEAAERRVLIEFLANQLPGFERHRSDATLELNGDMFIGEKAWSAEVRTK